MKLRKVIHWLIVNGVMLTLGYYGIFEHVKMAENLYLFCLWFFVVVTTLCAAIEEVKKDAKDKGRSVPAWLSIPVDILTVLALASMGRFVCAAAVLWQMACESVIFSKE